MVTLKPFTYADLDTYRAWFNNPKLEEYFRRHPPLFTWNADEHILKHLEPCYTVSIDDKIVGMLSLNHYDPQQKCVELGVLLDKEQCPCPAKEIYFDACKQACSFVFDYLGYQRIYVYVLPHREHLMNTLEAVGFVKEGLIRSHVFWKGKFHDEYLFSLLSADYTRLYKKNKEN